MPMYQYRWTDEQGGGFEEFQHMRNDPLTTSEGRPCERTVQLFTPHTRFGKGNRCDPIEMMSIAVDSVAEVCEFRKRNPGVEISDNPRDRNFGVPIAASRNEKLKILQIEGFAER